MNSGDASVGDLRKRRASRFRWRLRARPSAGTISDLDAIASRREPHRKQIPRVSPNLRFRVQWTAERLDELVEVEEREDLEETRFWEELVEVADVESGGEKGNSEPFWSTSYPQVQARWLQNK